MSMWNIEFKVRCPDLAAVRARALDLGAVHHWTHHDTDTYFRARHGRLKLRETRDTAGATLIAYDRPDDSASRLSRYQLLPVDDPATLKAMLSDTLGVLATVVKTRDLYVHENTRIHLDRVDGLGDFVELETVLAGQPEDDARAEHNRVKRALELDRYEPVPLSYGDLVLPMEDRQSS
jgi:predicted adenylyl cyclase CyaB